MDPASPLAAPLLARRAADRAPVWGLVWTLVRTDFKTRYHGTLGGFLWALLKPLAMFVTLAAIFSFVFRSEKLYLEKLLVGLFLWDFFAEATRAGFVVLQQKGFLLGRAVFPRWILVATAISNPLIALAVFWCAMVGYLALDGRFPGVAGLALFTSYLLAMIVIVLGISLAASVLFLRYRDLNQVWDLVAQAGFFLAPIIWPIGTVPERFHAWLYLWPPTPLIEFSRAALLTEELPTLKANALLALGAATIFGVGASIFRRLAPRAAEYV